MFQHPAFTPMVSKQISCPNIYGEDLKAAEGSLSNTIWGSSGNFTGSLWTNYDFRVDKGTPSLNEIDPGLSYESSFTNFDYEVNIQAFLYPDQPEIPIPSKLL